MNVLRQAIQLFNPGQIFATAVDAHLNALAKYVQWNWRETLGEDQYVVVLGGPHIEQTMWKTLGDYLEGSEWTTALTQSDVASLGTADSFLNCCHITRQDTANTSDQCSCPSKAPARCRLPNRHTSNRRKEAWRQDMIEKRPTLQYWDSPQPRASGSHLR